MMLTKLTRLLFLAVLLGISTISVAVEPQPPSAAETPVTAEEFLASLKFQTGKIQLPTGIASLNLPETFRYLSPEDTEKVLVQAWGNPPGNTTLGMIFPADISPLDQDRWGVIITYNDDGHVDDEDADSIKYDELLKEMQGQMQAANEERKKQGYDTLTLVGWAEKPSYDKANHKLYWAKELSSEQAPENTLNYNIRVLGRKGVLVLNAVAGMSQIENIKAEMPKVLASTDFNQGYAYTDFDSKTDKVAGYGLAALVAGGVAAKMGVFGKLLALLLAFKKVLVVAVIALFAGIRKHFRLRKKDNPIDLSKD